MSGAGANGGGGKLYAIGDLHLSYPANREAFQQLRPHPNDGLILCGDMGEKDEHLTFAFSVAKRNFRQVFWVPGNHELYSMPNAPSASSMSVPRGTAKYAACLAIARRHGVHTPEDPFQVWHGEGGPAVVALAFTLYDYSFRPAEVRREDCVAWAEAQGTVATDEYLLHPDPYDTRDAWCADRVGRSEVKLGDVRRSHPGVPLVIVNHWPLRRDLVTIPQVPSFVPWCGTVKTEDWHTRFGARVVVSGHLHVPRTDWKQGTRFEECSFGYPRQWAITKSQGKDMNDLIREILPGPPPPEEESAATQWRRMG